MRTLGSSRGKRWRRRDTVARALPGFYKTYARIAFDPRDFGPKFGAMMARRVVRGKAGRFAPGTKPGPGNPHAKKIAAMRAELFSAISPADIRKVLRAMFKKAVEGDVHAASLILDRTLGKVTLDINGRLFAEIAIANRLPPGLPRDPALLDRMDADAALLFEALVGEDANSDGLQTGQFSERREPLPCPHATIDDTDG